MELGLTYILITSFLIIVLVFPLFIYTAKRKQKERSLDIKFAKQLKFFLRKRYPIYTFKFLKVSKDQSQNKQIAQVLLVESLIKQFTNFDFKLQTQQGIQSDKLWENYQVNSQANNSRLPSDWRRRRELVWQRDEKVCKRCKRALEFDEVQIFFLKNIEDGGTYEFENMLGLCIDCFKILSAPKETIAWQTLPLYDEMMDFVED